MQVTQQRRVLVTGASYGLGLTVAAEIRERGDEAYTISRTAPPDVDAATWIEADLGDIETIPAVVGRLADRAGGPFDAVVFNAALADKSRSQWTVDQVERHLRINAISPFALWDALESQGLIASPCNVVLMGSFLQNGNVRQPAYAMSKAALWSWMRSYTMRQDIDDPVSMNMVWPGRVITPANPKRELPAGDPNNFYPPERVAQVVLGFVYQDPGGPRGTVVDLGRS
jgi:NAD(P)-dependent dehydrogenase (short-subunit alcohol dehydrogenase family)